MAAMMRIAVLALCVHACLFSADALTCQSSQAKCPQAGKLVCVNINTNNLNCGKCGHACPVKLSCCNGACIDMNFNQTSCGKCGLVCRRGTTCCGATCTSLLTDPQHCSACGTSCVNTLEGVYKSCCNGTCIDTAANDVKHCGGCKTVCGVGKNKGLKSCCYGNCQASGDQCVAPGR
eukprot:TRINITY_DN127_c0_g1_i2.p1 TRINITY_DN127_c0_g1~~TRINITY_DN127_c0_g1_i2.p1  ORF type:complete len:177 (+),score=3.05 TRINITY_DN127_c0_g1_i2:132-662(+)